MLSVLKSFRHALNGLYDLFFSERNAKIHLAAAVLVVIAGILLDFPPWKWIAVSFAITFVWIAEAFNTSIELLCDKVEPGRDELIRKIKDISAAAVFIATVSAIVTACFVFFTS